MPGTSTDTVPAKLTPGEFVIKRESAKMLGLPFLRQLNAVSDNAAHSNMDALIAQAELSNMKPMMNGGKVAQGYKYGGKVAQEYENGGNVEKEGLLAGLLSMRSMFGDMPVEELGQGYQEGDVVKDDDPLQIDKRMADPSMYNRSVISGKFGEARGIPDAWMQPATEPMPTAGQEAEFLKELNKIRIEQLIEKLKEEQIFNPTEIGRSKNGMLFNPETIEEKRNFKGQKFSDFMQMMPYIENSQLPSAIINRPPLPR